MTVTKILPYNDINTRNLTKCSIEPADNENLLDELGMEPDESEHAVVMRDPDGNIVASITYKERYEDTSESTLFFAESVAVNVASQHNLAEIMKMLCNYVSEIDDCWKWRFLFNSHISDVSLGFYSTFCEFETIMLRDQDVYMSYEG